MAKNDTATALVTDVLSDISQNEAMKEFYDKEEIKEALNTLVCNVRWRHEIEAYEYLSYIIDLTYIAVRKFMPEDGQKVDRSFWQPILNYYFEDRLKILATTDNCEYAVLSNFYPLTKPLKDCRAIVSKLNTLVVINKQTKGVNNEGIRQMGKQLYEALSDTFGEIGEDKYMSYKDSMFAYKTLVLNGLSEMIRLENMEAVGNLSTNKDKPAIDTIVGKGGQMGKIGELVTSAVPVGKEENKSVTETPIQEGVIEIAPAQNTETVEIQSESQTTIVERAVEEQPVEKPIENAECNPVVEVEMAGDTQPMPIQRPIPLEQTVNMATIQKLIDGKGFDSPKALLPREEWLKVFISEFQDINTRCCMANRHNDTEAVDFYKNLLKSLFLSYFNQRELTDKAKHTRGFKPDFEKWDEAKDNIRKTQDKLDITLGIKVDGKWI